MLWLPFSVRTRSFVSTPGARLAGVLLLLAVTSTAMAEGTYYVSPSGNDANSGLSPDQAWRSVEKVNTSDFGPGSEVLFQRGGEWRERLDISVSGTPESPIVFADYGSGPKPRFIGSDIVDTASLSPVPEASGVFSVSRGEPVNSTFIDQQFLRQAKLATGSTNRDTRLNWVQSTPDSWDYMDGKLYVNPGTTDLAAGDHVLSAGTRESMVRAQHVSNVQIRNLVTDETAADDGGYGFGLVSTENVTIDGAEAYRAGKHHFAAISSKNFIGRNLYAAEAMPDQGHGGASHYVSFTDDRRSGDSSTWQNIVAESPNGSYPAFISHGSGIEELTIDGLRSPDGAGLWVAGQNIRGEFRDINIENNTAIIHVDQSLIDGMTLTGDYAQLRVHGSDNTVQNVLIDGAHPDFWSGRNGAIQVSGQNNLLRFNTVVIDSSAGRGAVLSLKDQGDTTEWYANLFVPSNNGVILRERPSDDVDLATLAANHNLFPTGSVFALEGEGEIGIADWRDMGLDVDSILADPLFVDAASGNYRLLPGSPGASMVGLDPVALGVLTDLLGRTRTGTPFTVGAFTIVPEPAIVSISLLLLACHRPKRRKLA